MTQLLIHLFVRHPDDTKNAAVRTAYGNLASLVGMACNLLLCLGKLAAGPRCVSETGTAESDEP